MRRIHDVIRHSGMPASRKSAHSKELFRVFSCKRKPNDEGARFKLSKPQTADHRRGIVRELLQIGAARPPQTARIDYWHAQQGEEIEELLACGHIRAGESPGTAQCAVRNVFIRQFAACYFLTFVRRIELMRRIALFDATRVRKELLLDGSQQRDAHLHCRTAEISKRGRV